MTNTRPARPVPAMPALVDARAFLQAVGARLLKPEARALWLEATTALDMRHDNEAMRLATRAAMAETGIRHARQALDALGV